MSLEFKGKTWKYGDNVDTDVIIPARYLNTSDPDELAAHCLEDLDGEFAGKVHPGDFIVAGRNFGCGSSREHAPLAIKARGVSAVIAASFARIFFRNAINIGLPIFESEEAAAAIRAGDELLVDAKAGTIKNLTRDELYRVEPLPGFIQGIIEQGGLIGYVRTEVGVG